MEMNNHSKRNISIKFISHLKKKFEQEFYAIIKKQNKGRKKFTLELHLPEDDLKELSVQLVEAPTSEAELKEHSLDAYSGKFIKIVVGENITLDQEAYFIRMGFSDAIDLKRINLKGIKRAIHNAYFRQMFAKKNSELKEKIQHSSKLATLGLITAGVAHELNNPLTALKGFCYRLSKPNLTSQKVQEISQKIISVADRMSRVIEGIRANSMQRNYQDNEEFSPFSVLQEVMNFMKMILGPKGIAVEQEGEFDENLKILGNRGKFESIFQNIISNAKDAIAEKMLSGGVIRIKSRVEKEKWTIAISDNGMGMSEEVQKKIFYPFYTTKEIGAGTGLGMGIIKEAVEGHQGTMDIESKYGEGSTITLTFLLSDSKVSEAKKQAPLNGAVNLKGKIFVVDNDPLVTEAIQTALEKDYQIVAFNNAHVALEAIVKDKKHIALVITDLVMPDFPDFDGLQFARAIKKDSPKLPIWVTATERNLQSIKQNPSNPFGHIIIKPIRDFSLLAEDIQKFFGR